MSSWSLLNFWTQPCRPLESRLRWFRTLVKLSSLAHRLICTNRHALADLHPQLREPSTEQPSTEQPSTQQPAPTTHHPPSSTRHRARSTSSPSDDARSASRLRLACSCYGCRCRVTCYPSQSPGDVARYGSGSGEGRTAAGSCCNLAWCVVRPVRSCFVSCCCAAFCSGV